MRSLGFASAAAMAARNPAPPPPTIKTSQESGSITMPQSEFFKHSTLQHNPRRRDHSSENSVRMLSRPLASVSRVLLRGDETGARA